MADGIRGARRTRIADVLAIGAGLWALMFAVWGPGLAQPSTIEGLVRYIGVWWAGAAAAGALAVGSVLVALRSTPVARIMTGVAGLILLGTLAAFARITWVPIVAVLIPGLVLLAVAPFVGPMPSPEEEGRPR